MVKADTGSDTRTVNTSFEFNGNTYRYIAEVEYNWSYTPMTYYDPPEHTFEVTNISIEELIWESEEHGDVQLIVDEMENDLIEAIEEDAAEQAERG